MISDFFWKGALLLGRALLLGEIWCSRSQPCDLSFENDLLTANKSDKTENSLLFSPSQATNVENTGKGDIALNP